MHRKNRKKQYLCESCLIDIAETLNPLEWFVYEDLICRACRKQIGEKIYKAEKKSISLYCLYHYESLFKDLLYQYKEEYDINLAPIFLFNYRSLIKKLSCKKSLVCAPTSANQFEQRGFEPCEQMLRTSGIKYESCFIKTSLKPQKNRSKQERFKVKEEIELKNLPKNKEVVLFDDICTTGNTMETCKQLLEEKKYKVFCIILANVGNE